MKDSDASMAFALMQDLHQKLYTIEQQLMLLKPATQQIAEIIHKYIPASYAQRSQASDLHLFHRSQLYDALKSSIYSLPSRRGSLRTPSVPALLADTRAPPAIAISTVDLQNKYGSETYSEHDFSLKAEEVGFRYIPTPEQTSVHYVSSTDVRQPDEVFEEVEAMDRKRVSTTTSQLWSDFAKRISRTDKPKDSSKKSLEYLDSKIGERPNTIIAQAPPSPLRNQRSSIIQTRSVGNSPRNYTDGSVMNESPDASSISIESTPVGFVRNRRSTLDLNGFTPSSMPVSRKSSQTHRRQHSLKAHKGPNDEGNSYSSPLKAAYMAPSEAPSMTNTPRASKIIPTVSLISAGSFGVASISSLSNNDKKSPSLDTIASERAEAGSPRIENGNAQLEVEKQPFPNKSYEAAKDDAELPTGLAKISQNTHTKQIRKKLLGDDLENNLSSSVSTFGVARRQTLKLVIESALTPKYTVKGSFASLPRKSESNLQDHSNKSGSNVANKVDILKLSKSKKFTGLNPLSIFNVNYECFMAVLYTATLWIIPLTIAFEIWIHWVFSLILSTFFFFDVIVEFNTFRPNHPEVVVIKDASIQVWRWIYIQRYLLIDVITIIPFELLQFPNSNYLWFIRFLRFYKLPRILGSSPKILALRKRLENALGIGQTFSGIFPLMFALCAFLHVQACAIFLVGRLEGFSNPAIQSVADKSVGDQYVWAVFTATGNTFPLTYKPLATSEQLTVLVFIIVGAGLYASIVGTISSFAMGMDASGRLYKQKMDELREYMRWKDLSQTTRRKVMKYYEVKYRGKFFEEGTLLGEMNDSLRMEIAVHNCKELIQKVSFLRREMNDGKDELFVGRIATALKACYFVPGDVIITQGEIGFDMYFILNGCVNIIVNGKRVVQFKDGAFFGELALIANIPRTATVQAAAISTMYRLTRPDFMSILTEFEDMRKRIDIIYNERMERVRLEEEAKAKANGSS